MNKKIKRVHFTVKPEANSKIIRRVHFIGVGGSGISGVASLASKMGYEVTGCDLESSTAYTGGESHPYFTNIFRGHDPVHVESSDLVVVSPAVFFQDPQNLEVAVAKRQRKLMTWQEFVGTFLVSNKEVICIAGTHGKSTTTAMVGKLLMDAGLDPTVIIGARVPEWRENSRFGKGKYFVIEADEFNDNFLNYHPDIIILNNIEFDHPDYFKNEVQVKKSFKTFIGNLVGRKILITQKDNLHKKFNLKVLGQHNQDNANMVYVLGKKLKIDESTIVKSLESFAGIDRRLELIANKNGIEVYDDYAHHPTAIAATLQALRDANPKARIWAVDEPHGFVRTKALLPLYSDVFKDADKVLIGPIFKARDKESFGVSPESIANISGHKDIRVANSFDEIKEILKHEAKKGDIILVMGAGKSYLWSREIVKLIK